MYYNSNDFQDNTRRESTYPETIPGVAVPRRKSSNGKRFAGILCACLVTSSVAGFGGGYLAGSMNSSVEQAAPAVQSTAQTTTSQQQTTAAPDNSGAMSVAQVVDAVSDSVVEINTEVVTGNFFMQTTAEAAGSGVIISEDGYIITNNHVIEDAQQITVRLKNEETYQATLVGTDPQTDVAVIKIDATGLKAAKVGDSSALVVGDDAIAIGNPLGELGGTVTNGIISATSREVTVGDETMNLLQTNAAINPGNSGGGLFNNRGELIGIVVAKSSGNNIEGLGFAIPINTAMEVANDLIANGYVTGRAELGISVLDITDERTAFMYRVPQLGVYVAQVQDGSAAQRAGLKVGDGIVAIGETEISSSSELKEALENYAAGDTVQVTVLRDGSRQTLSVTLQESVPDEVKQQQTPTPFAA